MVLKAGESMIKKLEVLVSDKDSFLPRGAHAASGHGQETMSSLCCTWGP
jgi:hypothetical protein